MIISIFGDSIAWGAHDLQLGGWVNRLRLYFNNKGDYETDVYNNGISGDYIKGVLKRFDTEAQARNPDMIILAIGINDTSHAVHPLGTKLSNFEEQYEELLKKAQKITRKIIIVGLTNVKPRNIFLYRNGNIEKYDQKIREIAQKHKLPFVDLFNLLSSDEFEDGLHPNAKGHQKIFEKVKNLL